MEIMVYFNNGNRARFDAENVVFTRIGAPRDFEYTAHTPQIASGGAVVNWDSVAFIRKIDDEREEDDEP